MDSLDMSESIVEAWGRIGAEPWGTLTLEATIQRQGKIKTAKVYAIRRPRTDGAEYRVRTAYRDSEGWHNGRNETYATIGEVLAAWADSITG